MKGSGSTTMKSPSGHANCQYKMSADFWLALLGFLALIADIRPGLSQGELEPKDNIKRQIVAVVTPGSSGTGTIVGRKGSTYAILTAAHVIQGDIKKEEFYAVPLLSDYRYRLTSCERPNQAIDLAVCTFAAPEDFYITPISTLDRWTPNRYDSAAYPPVEGKFSATDDLWGTWDVMAGVARGAGISLATGSIKKPVFRYTLFSLTERVVGNQNGYEFIYSAATMPGMSGGPLLGARATKCWPMKDRRYPFYWLLAIHGQSEGYSSGGRSGYSLGVPVDLIKGFLESNAKRLGIPKSKSEFQSLVVRQYCADG